MKMVELASSITRLQTVESLELGLSGTLVCQYDELISDSGRLTVDR